MRIDINPRQYVVLSSSQTEPATQAEVLEACVAASREWLDLREFSAGAVLRSLDGCRVVAYRQFTRPPEPEDVAAHGLPTPTDSHTYRVIRLEAAPLAATSPLDILPGVSPTTLINIFDTDSARQTQLVDTWIRVGEPFTHHPGFRRAALHQSIDGTRVVNFAHWNSPSDWQDLVAHHAQDFAVFRPLGQSDPHLYEVVHVLEPANVAAEV
jgi:hypothetical protein